METLSDIMEDESAPVNSDFNVIVTGGRDPREWQCIECGYVKESKTRPKSCPDCNCVQGDFAPGVNLFARRGAVGWFE